MTATPNIALDLSWDELNALVAHLADQIRIDGVPDIVVGVLRGGMVPAVMLAHQLGVRAVRGVEITHTLTDQPNGAKSSDPTLVNPTSVGEINGADVLLVDDVAGSGETAAAATNLLSPRAGRVRSAVLVVNTINWNVANSSAPYAALDYLGTTCNGWVRFPWEVR